MCRIAADADARHDVESLATAHAAMRSVAYLLSTGTPMTVFGGVGRAAPPAVPNRRWATFLAGLDQMVGLLSIRALDDAVAAAREALGRAIRLLGGTA